MQNKATATLFHKSIKKDKEINKQEVKEEIVQMVDPSVPASVLFIKIPNLKTTLRKE